MSCPCLLMYCWGQQQHNMTQLLQNKRIFGTSLVLLLDSTQTDKEQQPASTEQPQ